MYRWSKIPEKHRPEIISDISGDDKLYTFIVQDAYRKCNRIEAKINRRVRANYAFPSSIDDDWIDAWCGHYSYLAFKSVIDKNIPCVLMHKVKNKRNPEIDIVVCFMTGECNDVFLVHPKDLIEWDPNEKIDHA